MQHGSVTLLALALIALAGSACEAGATAEDDPATRFGQRPMRVSRTLLLATRVTSAVVRRMGAPSFGETVRITAKCGRVQPVLSLFRI